MEKMKREKIAKMKTVQVFLCENQQRNFCIYCNESNVWMTFLYRVEVVLHNDLKNGQRITGTMNQYACVI